MYDVVVVFLESEARTLNSEELSAGLVPSYELHSGQVVWEDPSPHPSGRWLLGWVLN